MLLSPEQALLFLDFWVIWANAFSLAKLELRSCHLLLRVLNTVHFWATLFHRTPKRLWNQDLPCFMSMGSVHAVAWRCSEHHITLRIITGGGRMKATRMKIKFIFHLLSPLIERNELCWYSKEIHILISQWITYGKWETWCCHYKVALVLQMTFAASVKK